MSPHTLTLKGKYYNHGLPTWIIDTKLSKWFEMPVHQLGAYGRRRFENWVVIENMKNEGKFNIHYA